MIARRVSGRETLVQRSQACCRWATILQSPELLRVNARLRLVGVNPVAQIP
jgi:hypothetical protein